MTPQNPKRIRQADLPPDGRDVYGWPRETGKSLYKVTCRRKASPGVLEVQVRADSPQQAKQLVRDGKVEGIGLGWQPLSAVVQS